VVVVVAVAVAVAVVGQVCLAVEDVCPQRQLLLLEEEEEEEGREGGVGLRRSVRRKLPS
jgi:hypothetical protein